MNFVKVNWKLRYTFGYITRSSEQFNSPNYWHLIFSSQILLMNHIHDHLSLLPNAKIPEDNYLRQRLPFARIKAIPRPLTPDIVIRYISKFVVQYTLLQITNLSQWISRYKPFKHIMQRWSHKHTQILKLSLFWWGSPSFRFYGRTGKERGFILLKHI